MNVLAQLRIFDAVLRIRGPRIWAMQLQYLALPMLVVPLAATIGFRWLARLALWSPADGVVATGVFLAIASALVLMWVVFSARACKTLPRAQGIGWFLSPTCTFLLSACALLATTLATTFATDAANRALISREELLEDAAALGVLYTVGGEPRIGDSPNGSLDEVNDEERMCSRLQVNAKAFENSALRYVRPSEREGFRARIIEAAARCANPTASKEGLVLGQYPHPEDLWYYLQPFAVVHGLDPHAHNARPYATITLVALEVAVLATAVMSILMLTSVVVLRRVMLVLSAFAVAVITLAPTDGLQAEDRAAGKAFWCSIMAALCLVIWLLTMMIGAYRRRTPGSDYAFSILLLLPVFGAAFTHLPGLSWRGYVPGWSWHDMYGWSLWLPYDRRLWPGLAIAIGYAIISPLMWLFMERYRRLRWHS